MGPFFFRKRERIGEGAAQEEGQRQLTSPGLPVSTPEDDGYQWKKYGKKYNKSIRKNRIDIKCSKMGRSNLR
ncbi:hypothetical protein HPP92_015656 [Vanilla planifolia]|uniref:WRKY domain-containing protein n=1 Tax=Vanilla planifolia TaxID=51239 RepID=A0A835US89_VANPL|nr:hypothetical protein HPP92_015656 [Vanilla planifolia]